MIAKTSNEINDYVKKYFGALGVYCWRNNQFRQADRRFRGRKGGSDVIGVTTKLIRICNKTFESGLFFACEGKGIGDKLSEEQKDFLNHVRDSGGVALVAEANEKGSIDFFEFDYERYPKKILK